MPDNDLKPLGKHGGPRPGAGRPKKGENREKKNQLGNTNLISAKGTTRAYVIARLTRDGFTELAAKVRAGEMSAFAAAAVALGWARRPQTVHGQEARRRAVIDVKSLIG